MRHKDNKLANAKRIWNISRYDYMEYQGRKIDGAFSRPKRGLTREEFVSRWKELRGME